MIPILLLTNASTLALLSILAYSNYRLLKNAKDTVKFYKKLRTDFPPSSLITAPN
jgi:hypothetical protein